MTTSFIIHYLLWQGAVRLANVRVDDPPSAVSDERLGVHGEYPVGAERTLIPSGLALQTTAMSSRKYANFGR
jgi:hypothetical protein